jgi:hypothetical protein
VSAAQAAGRRRSTPPPPPPGAGPAPGQRWKELKADLRELIRPMLAWWFFLGSMFAAFSAAAFWESPGGESAMMLAFFALVTVTSCGLGQILALLRLREWVLYALWGLTWTVGAMAGTFAGIAAGMAGLAPLVILLFIYIFLGPLFMMGGAWSLQTNRALWATWVPLIYATGAVIIVAESEGKVSTWKEGSKWAVWDVFTFAVFGLGVVMLLAYLVTRESHRLHLWRASPRGPRMGSVEEKGASRPRLSCGGWLLLLFLGAGLSVATAAIAPYLWRTEERPEGDRQGEQQREQEEQKKPPKQKPSKKKDQKKKSPKDRAKQAADSVSEQIQENLQPRVQQGIDLLSTLITLFLMAIAALLLFWRPVKRLLLVRHLRRPWWRVSSTTRIEQGWRLVEIALGDAGVPVEENEAAVSLVGRSGAVLRKMSAGRVEVHGLEEAAQIRDRVAFGLGVGPKDVQHMEQVASWAYDTVWDRLRDRGQIRALYRGL